MKVLSLIAFMCVYSLCFPQAAKAGRLCSDSAKDWACFGQAEVKLSGPKDQKIGIGAKVLFFNNNEKIIEVEKDGIKLYKLTIPRKMELYSGTPKTENLQNNEIDKLVLESSLLIVFPIELLKDVYPAGPVSVGTGISTIKNEEAGKTITTTRTNEHHIDFVFEDSTLVISGSWDSQLAEPYPDDFDLTGWSHTGTATMINDLSDARHAIPRLK